MEGNQLVIKTGLNRFNAIPEAGELYNSTHNIVRVNPTVREPSSNFSQQNRKHVSNIGNIQKTAASKERFHYASLGDQLLRITVFTQKIFIINGKCDANLVATLGE